MIALALACEPAVIVADEPTTALDVMIQAQILELLAELVDELGMSMILITHDLGVVAQTCDDVVVMYGGVVAEQGSVADVFWRRSQPYTRLLLEAFPTSTSRNDRWCRSPGHLPGSASCHPDAGSHPAAPTSSSGAGWSGLRSIGPARELPPPVLAGGPFGTGRRGMTAPP